MYDYERINMFIIIILLLLLCSDKDYLCGLRANMNYRGHNNKVNMGATNANNSQKRLEFNFIVLDSWCFTILYIVYTAVGSSLVFCLIKPDLIN